MMRNAFRALLLGSGAAAAMALPNFAFAQATDDETIEEVVVTGSRIRRDTFNAPVPVSVISAEQIVESGALSIGDMLMETPIINAAANAQNTSGTLFLAGQARADIRGLGATRTLVLADGRRIVFSDASSPAVDLNLIPSMMVERIETVAGGASAVYGSEAISGVVNLIMKKQFDGFQIEGQIGASQEGDGEQFRISALYGRKLMDDRLNILIGGEVSREEPVMQRDRDWAYPGIRRNLLANPQTVIPQSRSNVAPTATFQLLGGAVGTARAVTLDYRDPTKVVRLSGPCSTPTVQPTCQDEALYYNSVFSALQAKSQRGTIRGYADYDLTDNIKAFLDVTYSRVDGYGIFGPAFSNAVGGGTMPTVLKGNNAYLNGAGATAAALRAEWLAAGKTLTSTSTAQIGKTWVEFGGRDVKTERETIRVVFGMEGDFEFIDRNVNWDWYAQLGKTSGSTTSFNVPYVERVQFATDAILSGGQIICAATIDPDPAKRARAAGCVPWDLINGPSQEAVAWANGQSSSEQEVKQTVISGNIATDLFDLPAGPVGFAMGAEYRKEQSAFSQDAAGASGLLFFNAIGARGGEYDTWEGYAEIRVPLLRDLPFAQELNFEMAGRAAEYSTIGKTDQWQARLEWAPIQDIRFRASEGTAVRAPNIVELYAPQSQNFTTAAVDPCDKASYAAASASQKALRLTNCSAAIAGYNPLTFVSNFGPGRSSLQLRQGGNPDLGPEMAHTYNLGVVIQPRLVPDLKVSLDYFKYNLTGMVGTIPINTLLQGLCYESATPYASNPLCSLIVRDASGAQAGVPGGVSVVNLVNRNVASMKIEGYDASLQYGFDLERLFKQDFGQLAFRLDATWMYRFALQGLPGQPYTQLANTITSNTAPEWRGSGTVQWTHGDYGVTWTTRYIGSLSSTTASTPSGLSPYYTGDFYTHDLKVRARINDDLDVRAGVLNLSNEHPPELPEVFTGTGAGSSMYDNRGRFFFVGATLRY
ncbi:TonB-dependent receptor [Phenylobacterium sp. LH3H17]|uniref:TonB-dependent receptor plug domain-containing protein n=1 Tax=Phenylobacterium sp. LH3H17 TaxID=2903901 RepID=UPI0020C9BF2C|nr:TonB-dependent receptor [Phenylobacterium sp. LH3H17]UTP40620.1 TonB-dependent receptor [Phenylobacterium sp. LH3H17]